MRWKTFYVRCFSYENDAVDRDETFVGVVRDNIAKICSNNVVNAWRQMSRGRARYIPRWARNAPRLYFGTIKRYWER